MINAYNTKKYLEKFSDRWGLHLSEDGTKVLNNDTNDVFCEFDTFVTLLKRALHCDFESIYYCHATLDEIYRCKECGTVIFCGDDFERYDPNCRCPVCCHDESVCRNEYWTKEQIDADEKKQNTIKFYIQMQEEMRAAEKRREQRGGLYDFERFKKKWHIGKYLFVVTHYCFDNKNKPFHNDRYLEISCNKGESKDDFLFNNCWTVKIPLNVYTFWLNHIYRYTKRCPSELRKYAFWQKKSAEAE